MTHWPGNHAQMESTQTAAQRLSSTSFRADRFGFFSLTSKLVARLHKRLTVTGSQLHP